MYLQTFTQQRILILKQSVVLSALLLTLSFEVSAFQLQNLTAEKKRAGYLLNSRNYKEAETLLERLVRINQSDPEIIYGLGVATFMQSMAVKDQVTRRQ